MSAVDFMFAMKYPTSPGPNFSCGSIFGVNTPTSLISYRDLLFLNIMACLASIVPDATPTYPPTPPYTSHPQSTTTARTALPAGAHTPDPRLPHPPPRAP